MPMSYYIQMHTFLGYVEVQARYVGRYHEWWTATLIEFLFLYLLRTYLDIHTGQQDCTCTYLHAPVLSQCMYIHIPTYL